MYIGYGYYIVAMTETKQLVDDPKVIKSCMTDPSLAGVTYISMTKNMQLNIPPRPPIARKRQIQLSIGLVTLGSSKLKIKPIVQQMRIAQSSFTLSIRKPDVMLAKVSAHPRIIAFTNMFPFNSAMLK